VETTIPQLKARAFAHRPGRAEIELATLDKRETRLRTALQSVPTGSSA